MRIYRSKQREKNNSHLSLSLLGCAPQVFWAPLRPLPILEEGVLLPFHCCMLYAVCNCFKSSLPSIIRLGTPKHSTSLNFSLTSSRRILTCLGCQLMLLSLVFLSAASAEFWYFKLLESTWPLNLRLRCQFHASTTTKTAINCIFRPVVTDTRPLFSNGSLWRHGSILNS